MFDNISIFIFYHQEKAKNGKKLLLIPTSVSGATTFRIMTLSIMTLHLTIPQQTDAAGTVCGL
jgi:hypothetical protein